MKSFSELECAFISNQFSVSEYFSACNFIMDNGFYLDSLRPGYVYADDFQYPDWQTIAQAIDYIANGKYRNFCINFSSSQGSARRYRLSLEADIESKCIAVKVGEEYFLNKSINRIDVEKLIDFIGFMQDISLCISVKMWKIAQSGFSYDSDGIAEFIKYSSANYPKSDIEKIIDWYDKKYLTRWNG